MTAKLVKESEEGVVGVCDIEKPKELSMDPNNKKLDRKVEEEESDGSSEEESPKSVVKYVHCQILRIREEDSHLGKDSIGFSAKEKDNAHHRDRDRDRIYHEVVKPMQVVLYSRPILPCSPLSGKNTTTTVKALH